MADPALVQALAFVYITFAQATDGTLDPKEMRTLAGRLQKRAPELSLEDLGEILRATVAEYQAIGSRQARIEKALAFAATLRDVLDENMRQAMVADLVEIAGADGEVSEPEQRFIESTAQALGVALPAA